MTLQRWDPIREVTSLRDAMGRLFQESVVLPSAGATAVGAGRFGMDLAETENAFVVSAELPGVKPEDVQVTVQGATLTIRGQSTAEEEQKDKHWHVRERRAGAFHRSVTLPTPVNADQAQAQFEHGILTLTLPKAEEAKPKQIRVGGAAQPQLQRGEASQG